MADKDEKKYQLLNKALEEVYTKLTKEEEDERDEKDDRRCDQKSIESKN